jgi:hypothetical protein
MKNWFDKFREMDPMDRFWLLAFIVLGFNLSLALIVGFANVIHK